MKNIYYVFVMALCVVTSCTTDEIETTPADMQQANLELPGLDDETTTGTTQIEEVDLMAGQHIDVGSVTVTLDGNSVIVTYTTDGDWEIQETHLYVGDLNGLPTNGGGNPKIGQFPYKDTYPSGTQTVTVITIELAPGECVYVAAHAVVENTTSGQNETAWGDGEPIGGNNWSMMFEICAPL